MIFKKFFLTLFGGLVVIIPPLYALSLVLCTNCSIQGILVGDTLIPLEVVEGLYAAITIVLMCTGVCILREVRKLP
jgi:hypothetical protein